MFKLDQVKNLLNCDQCNQLLVDPVAIPCGYSVCKKHLDELLENSMEDNKFKCELCHDEHTIPERGFVINRRIQNALDIELNKFKPSRIFEECKKGINDARANIAMIEALEKDPENYIYEYFEEIKRKVDLRREEIKSKVDSYSDEVIRSIENTKQNCVRLSKEANTLNTKIEEQKKALTELLERFDRFDVEETRLERVKQSATMLNNYLTKTLEKHRYLFLGRTYYDFELSEKFKVKNVFGCFKEVKNVMIQRLLVYI